MDYVEERGVLDWYGYNYLYQGYQKGVQSFWSLITRDVFFRRMGIHINSPKLFPVSLL